MEDKIQHSTDFEDVVHEDLKNFCQNNCGEFDTFPEILAEIRKFEVKKVNKKISKLTLQIMGFAYTRMIGFPNSDLLISAFASAKFFEDLHHLTTGKLNLHHSHATEKIHGYDFRNLKVKGNQHFVSSLAHNIFSFDIYFALRGIRLPV